MGGAILKKPLIKYFKDGEWHYATVKDIGDLDMLNTFEKETIVDAINSIVINGNLTNENMVKVVKSLEDKIKIVDENLDAHISNRNNPHGVTTEQIGTYSKSVIDNKDDSILTQAKAYIDNIKVSLTELINNLKNNTYTKTEVDAKDSSILSQAKKYVDSVKEIIEQLIANAKTEIGNNTYTKVETDTKINNSTKTVQDNLDSHTSNVSNPHNVTASQVGTYTKSEIDSKDSSVLNSAKNYTYSQADINAKDSSTLSSAKSYADTKANEVQNSLNNHVGNRNNPHGVTAGQVGTYTKSEIDGKISGVTNSISGNVSEIKNKLDNLQVGGRNLYIQSANNTFAGDILAKSDTSKVLEKYGFKSKSFYDTKPAGLSNVRLQQLQFNGITYATVSFDAYVNTGSLDLRVDICDKGNRQYLVSATKIRFSLFVNDVTNYNTSDNYNGFVDFAFTLAGGQTLYVENIMVEYATTPSNHTPAPEDQQSQIDSLNNSLSNNYYQKSTIDSKLTIDGQGITTYVKNTQSKLDNLQVGGRNLIKNTSKEIKNATQDTWSFVASNGYTVNFNILEHLGKTLTFRVWIENPTDVCRIQIWIKDKVLKTGNYIQAGQSGYSQFTVDVPKDGITSWNIAIGNDKTGTQLSYGYKNLKCEVGNIPTDWSPAPEDMATKEDVSTTLSQANKYSDTKKTEANSYTDGEISKIKASLSNGSSGVTPDNIGTYTKSEIDSKDTTTLNSAKSYADGKATSVQNNLNGHTNNRSNPHGVTASQVGTYTKQEIDTKDSSTLSSAKSYADGKANTVQNNLNSHTGNRSNPHGVTASQVGAYSKSETYSRAEVDSKVIAGVGNIIIGGENLVRNTRNYSTGMISNQVSGSGTTTTVSIVNDTNVPSGKAFRITRTHTSGAGYGGRYFSMGSTVLKTGRTYTWTVLARGTGTITAFGSEQGGTKSVTLTNDWKRIEHTFVVNKENYFQFVFYSDKEYDLYFTDIMIVEGNVGVGWHPNSEEMATDVELNDLRNHVIFVGTEAQWKALGTTEQNKYILKAIVE